jgi:dTMP kinase
MMSGKLIVLEGIDGSGTTTQAARLGEFLDRIGQPALVTREPSHGPIGLELRKILGGAHAPVDPAAMALLFAADRVDHLSREILPALAAGRHVVTDRYVLSSLAYQSIVVDRDLVVSFNARARRADLTLLLDVPVAVAAERRRARGGSEELYDAIAFQEKVAANYRREAELLWQAGDAVMVIDGAPDADSVFAALADAVKTCVLPGRNPS